MKGERFKLEQGWKEDFLGPSAWDQQHGCAAVQVKRNEGSEIPNEKMNLY